MIVATNPVTEKSAPARRHSLIAALKRRIAGSKQQRSFDAAGSLLDQILRLGASRLNTGFPLDLNRSARSHTRQGAAKI
jgi:hypothetical protein